MAILNPFTTANRQGIPRIETNSVNVDATNVVYSVSNFTLNTQPWNGLVAIRVSQQIPSGTTRTLPVLINNIPLSGLGGASVTASDITGTGVLLCWWESSTRTLQVINIV